MQQSSDALGQTFSLQPFPDLCKVFFLQQGFEQLQLFRLGFVEKSATGGIVAGSMMFSLFAPKIIIPDSRRMKAELAVSFMAASEKKPASAISTRSWVISSFSLEMSLHVVDPFGNIVEVL